jgi:hypothetical protein
MYRLIACIVSICFWSTSFAQPQRISYQQRVELTGTLESAPGETPDGKHVVFPSLRLTAPITVWGVPNDDLDSETEKGVSRIHLVLSAPLMEQYKKLKGKRATVVCSLFHSHTGHHHTKVLCDASSIAP